MHRFLNNTSAWFLTAAFLIFACSGCAPNPESKMKELASAVKTSINSTNLQFWALETLKTNTPYSLISEDKLPADILRLRNQGFQLEPDILETNCVILLCWKKYKIFDASTTGYYGICIGSTNFQPTLDTRRYTNWRPGIYFWYDKTEM